MDRDEAEARTYFGTGQVPKRIREQRFDCERCGVNVAYHSAPCTCYMIKSPT